jgi:hypothetical protein
LTQSSEQAQDLDIGFFRTTGLVLVVATLLAGGITLTLTINMMDTASTLIASNIGPEKVEAGGAMETLGIAADVALK